MVTIIMPKMGDGMEEGTLLEWLKKEGEAIKSGEVIGTIQTDKATLELEAPGEGVLSGVLVNPGDSVPVGKPIAVLLGKDEKLPADWANGSNINNTEETNSANLVESHPNQVIQEQEQQSAQQSRIKATPLAKKVAKSKDIDLTDINGSGIGGRIVEKDIFEYLENKIFLRQKVSHSSENLYVPLNRLRQIIGQKTQLSKQQAPHFYITLEVDIEKILELREWIKQENSDNLTINDFIIKACALSLKEMPIVNSSIQENQLIQFGNINIGIAATTDEGLFIPVIMNTETLTLRQIAKTSRELVQKARANKLFPNEMSNSTFSISNMGMLNVDNFIAIINTPNAAMLAISTAKKIPVVNVNGVIEPRSRMNITGSFDHRILDGTDGAKFMNQVRYYLENPTHLLS